MRPYNSFELLLSFKTTPWQQIWLVLLVFVRQLILDYQLSLLYDLAGLKP